MGQILPQLQQKLEQLPVSLPITMRLLEACYGLKYIPLACPQCLYNYLREAIPSAASLKPWQM